MQKVINLLCGVILIMLSSCQLLPTNKVTMAHEMPLLPPSISNQLGVVKQKMTMVAGNKTQTFIVVSNDQSQQFDVLVMVPTGQALMRMTFDGQLFNEENMTGLKLPAKEIMAIMQFASWPVETLAQSYKIEDGWTIILEAGFRRLDCKQKRFLDVQYQDNDRMIISNKRSRYQAIIEPLEEQ